MTTAVVVSTKEPEAGLENVDEIEVEYGEEVVDTMTVVLMMAVVETEEEVFTVLVSWTVVEGI